MSKRLLISGASVAGPALAYWLGRSGWDVTVVERAARLRRGGHAVDFRGQTHFEILERMGILDELRALRTQAGAIRFIDAQGRTKFTLPPEFAGGDLEVNRADLARVLVERSRLYADYIFGDSINALDQHGDGVEVCFENGKTRRFDLVIGADGIHSRTRHLLFGESFETDLGYVVAGWDAPGLEISGDTAMLLNEPGRMIGLMPDGRSQTARVFCMFATGKRNAASADAAKTQLRRVYADMGWRVPELLETLEPADDVFVSDVTRADPPNWHAGRVALVGDAASGVAVGGMGTGMALIGAYVLAGELSLDPDNPSAAFARYQQRLAGPVRAANRAASPGAFLAPRTFWGLWIRNRLLSFSPCQRWLIRESTKRTEISIPDYRSLKFPATPLCPALPEHALTI